MTIELGFNIIIVITKIDLISNEKIDVIAKVKKYIKETPMSNTPFVQYPPNQIN